MKIVFPTWLMIWVISADRIMFLRFSGSPKRKATQKAPRANLVAFAKISMEYLATGDGAFLGGKETI